MTKEEQKAKLLELDNSISDEGENIESGYLDRGESTYGECIKYLQECIEQREAILKANPSLYPDANLKDEGTANGVRCGYEQAGNFSINNELEDLQREAR